MISRTAIFWEAQKPFQNSLQATKSWLCPNDYLPLRSLFRLWCEKFSEKIFPLHSSTPQPEVIACSILSSPKSFRARLLLQPRQPIVPKAFSCAVMDFKNSSREQKKNGMEWTTKILRFLLFCFSEMSTVSCLAIRQSLLFHPRGRRARLEAAKATSWPRMFSFPTSCTNEPHN